jgi:uncharacterized linocin/CFP29 family protein
LTLKFWSFGVPLSKRHLYLRSEPELKTLRRVGLETGALTDEEIIYIDNRVVESVRPRLLAGISSLFSVFRLPHAGFKTVRGYKETDMGPATIDMDGETDAYDRIELAKYDIKVPAISKGFELNWRDIIAARNGGIPIDIRSAENAARQVIEEEEKLLLTGEMTGWRALGIEGLATATGRNTTAGGDWSANAFTYVNNAIGELETDAHLGPYALIVKPSWWRQIAGAFVSSTATTIAEKVAELCRAGVFTSDSLYESDGTTHNALVVEPGQENFELVLGQDLATFTWQARTKNTFGKVDEVVVPRIKRPTSICEITALT